MSTEPSRTSFDVRTERLNLIETRSRADQSSLMSEQAANEGEVEDWIKSVRALKERRKAEDEARNRQLEEDILRERKARQERRMTRGRSLSPTKNTPEPDQSLQIGRFESPSVEKIANVFPSDLNRTDKSRPPPEVDETSPISKSLIDKSFSKQAQKNEAISQLQSKLTPLKSELPINPSSKDTVTKSITDLPSLSKKPALGNERFLRSDQPDYSSLNSRMSRLMDQNIPKSPDAHSHGLEENVHSSSKAMYGTANSLPTSPIVRQVQSTPPMRRSGFDEAPAKPNLFDLRANLRSTKTSNRAVDDQVKETLLSAKSGLKSANDKPQPAAKKAVLLESPLIKTKIPPSLSEKKPDAKSLEHLPIKSIKTENVNTTPPQLPSRSSTLPSSGKEASKPSIFSRHDPRLASLLARGPPGNISAKSIVSSETDPTSPTPEPKASEKLQHLTKGRARRPKSGSKPLATDNQSGSRRSAALSDRQEVVDQAVTSPTPLRETESKRVSILADPGSKNFSSDIRNKAPQKSPVARPAVGDRQAVGLTTVSRSLIEKKSLDSPQLSSPKSPTIARSPSPFKRDSVLRHTPSKSVTGMTAVADLIRGRADSMARNATHHEKDSTSSVRTGSKCALSAWRVLSTSIQEMESAECRNIITKKSMLLIQDITKRVTYQWFGSDCEYEDPKEIQQTSFGEIQKIYMGEEPGDFINLLPSRIVISQDHGISKTSSCLFAVRKYMDGFAADQVALQATSLCSGFVYLLLSGQESQIWVGRGSFPAELDAAKTVLHLLQPTSEATILEEGSESPSFLSAIGGRAKYASSSYWKLKKDFPAYSVDLYTIERAKAVKHKVWSFQSLLARKVHIIDCFFEVYIYLWADNSKSDIKCAIQWCKEFCDRLGKSRPFIPMALVLCPNSKLPRDLAAVFRTTISHGKELRILEIDSAEALLQRKTFRYSELRTGNIIGCDLNNLDECIDPRDFEIAMGITRQQFQRLSSAEQNDFRHKAKTALASLPEL